jgi:hypothetical protein
MAGSKSRDGKCERLLWFCCPRFNLGGHSLAHGALCDVKPDGLLVTDVESQRIVDIENCKAQFESAAELKRQYKKRLVLSSGGGSRSQALNNRTRVTRMLAVVTLQLAHTQFHVVRSRATVVAAKCS